MREPAKDVTLWLLGPHGGAISPGQRLPRIAPPNPPARPGSSLPAGVSSEVTLGWNKVDRGLLSQTIGPNGGLLLNWRAGGTDRQLSKTPCACWSGAA
jgi:hypothetical protein